MTDKMKMFCLEYMKDFNASRAAVAAGYSEETSDVIGYENLRKPQIKECIDKLKKELVNDKNKIILENIIFWQTMRSNGVSKDVDRLRASEHLGKYADMFTDRVIIENISIGKPPDLADADFPED